MLRPGPQSYQKSSVRIRPTRPTTMRTTPTTSRSSPLGSSLTAQVRIAPDAMRIRLTAMPTFAVVPRAPGRRNLPESLLNSFRNDASPPGCDGRRKARTQEARVSGGYECSEDAESRRPARPGGTRLHFDSSSLAGLAGDQYQLAGDTRMAAPCRELFQPTHDEAGLGDDGDEVADRHPPPAARPEEVALTPVEQRVDARAHRMRLVQEQEAAGTQGSEQGAGRCGEVLDRRQRPLAGVGEVEPASQQLRRRRVHLRVDERGGRHAAA